ncbi:hypothetical protein AAJCM20276_17900 [Acetobacter aceti]|uniref:Uncharacterized protein n=1 Tax=Acetobacter aceti TaxID=435 RepID=A0A6S6PK16_ACEAC|nr:hypothetical protein AAJCM20276_17900 [Acetobacter aceti]
MLMRPDNGAVDHHVFVVVISGQITKYPFDHTAFTPAAQTSVHVFQSRNGSEDHARDTCTIAIQHSFYEKTVVCSRAPDMTLTTRKKVFYPLPLVVT